MYIRTYLILILNLEFFDFLFIYYVPHSLQKNKKICGHFDNVFYREINWSRIHSNPIKNGAGDPKFI